MVNEESDFNKKRSILLFKVKNGAIEFIKETWGMILLIIFIPILLWFVNFYYYFGWGWPNSIALFAALLTVECILYTSYMGDFRTRMMVKTQKDELNFQMNWEDIRNSVMQVKNVIIEEYRSAFSESKHLDEILEIFKEIDENNDKFGEYLKSFYERQCPGDPENLDSWHYSHAYKELDELFVQFGQNYDYDYLTVRNNNEMKKIIIQIIELIIKESKRFQADITY